MRQDITQQSDRELSLIVMNDEVLYKARHKSFFKDLIDQIFIYTPAQLAELQADLKEDADENNQ